MKVTIANEIAMQDLGAKLAAACGDVAVIYLCGELGAGKTTLTRGFLRALGQQAAVKSPTYSLVEPYHLHNKTIFHFDFYRVNHPEELEFIGIRDYVKQPAILLIEWPERAANLLPDPDLTCRLSVIGANHEVDMVANTDRGKEILSRLYS